MDYNNNLRNIEQELDQKLIEKIDDLLKKNADTKYRT